MASTLCSKTNTVRKKERTPDLPANCHFPYLCNYRTRPSLHTHTVPSDKAHHRPGQDAHDAEALDDGPREEEHGYARQARNQPRNPQHRSRAAQLPEPLVREVLNHAARQPDREHHREEHLYAGGGTVDKWLRWKCATNTQIPIKNEKLELLRIESRTHVLGGGPTAVNEGAPPTSCFHQWEKPCWPSIAPWRRR